jgi:hypothetical protein
VVLEAEGACWSGWARGESGVIWQEIRRDVPTNELAEKFTSTASRTRIGVERERWPQDLHAVAATAVGRIPTGGEGAEPDVYGCMRVSEQRDETGA